LQIGHFLNFLFLGQPKKVDQSSQKGETKNTNKAREKRNVSQCVESNKLVGLIKIRPEIYGNKIKGGSCQSRKIFRNGINWLTI